MRKVISSLALIASAITLLHCAAGAGGSGPGGNPSADDPQGTDSPVTERRDSGPRPAPTSPPSQFDAAPPAHDAGSDARTPDAAPPPPPPPTPGPACTALSECCGRLTSSVSAAACFLIVGKHNEYLCAGGYATFDCSNAGITTDLGPKCAQLSACCNSNQYIASDVQCTKDWKTLNENLCASDLHYYQTDPYGDCL